MRKFTKRLVDGKYFSGAILTVIFFNTILIAVQTDKQSEMSAGWYFSVIDNFFLGIYVFELFGKLFVWRKAFFKSGWNLFDMFIVLTSFIEYVQFLIASAAVINPRIFRLLRVFRAIRALRALRVLRTISFLNTLQVIVTTLLSSIPAMGNVLLLLLLIMYIFAIIGRTLYGDIYPSRFGTIFRAFFTLFQLITLDDWFEHYDKLRDDEPTSLIYLITFIVLATFILINLFIAVIVSSLEASQKKSKKRQQRDYKIQRRLDRQEARENDDVISAAAMAKKHANQPAVPVAKTVEYFYPESHIPNRQKQLMGYYFMLLSSVENTVESFFTQQRILDDLVDLTLKRDEEKDEDELG